MATADGTPVAAAATPRGPPPPVGPGRGVEGQGDAASGTHQQQQQQQMQPQQYDQSPVSSSSARFTPDSDTEEYVEDEDGDGDDGIELGQLTVLGRRPSAVAPPGGLGEGRGLDPHVDPAGATGPTGAAGFGEEYDPSPDVYSCSPSLSSSDDDDNRTNTPGGGRWGRSRRGRGKRRSPRSLSSTIASFQLYTPDEEAAVVRKFDLRLVLFLALLYMLSFLDRSNIGNARIAGMDSDLQTVPPRSDWYEWAITAFYVTYICFEWMSLLWRLVPAHVYVSLIVFSWGVTASLQAVAPSYPVLVALRAVLGVGEAGFAGVPFYLSFFFRREEMALRTAIFISAAPLATSFASSLAWAILKLSDGGPIAPWRLLFLVEGFPSVLASLVAWRVIPDSPQTASYLTAREKKVARLRLLGREEGTGERRPGSEGSVDDDDDLDGDEKRAPRSGETKLRRRRLNLREVLSVLADPAALLMSAMFFLTNMAYSSLPVFLPTIISDSMRGDDAARAQLLAALPHLASFVFVLAAAALSDRLRSRSVPVALCALLSAVGYALLALSEHGPGPFRLPRDAAIRYLAVFPAAAGLFAVVALVLAWAVGAQAGESRRGGGFALLQVVGQCGPLIGSRLYPGRDAPFYTPGMTACAVAMSAVALLALVVRWVLARRNRALDGEAVAAGAEGVDEDGDEEAQGLVSEGRKRSGNAQGGQGFRYML